MSWREKVPADLGGRDNDDDEPRPDTWDDPAKPGLIERYTPDSPEGIAKWGSAAILVVGGSLYMMQFFPTGPVVITTLLLAALPLAWVRGIRNHKEWMSELEWSILIDGYGGISVRYGESKSAMEAELRESEMPTENGILFYPAKTMNLRGDLEFRRVQDEFQKTEVRAKLHRTESETGDDRLTDYLPGRWTATINTGVLGTVHVTLTSGLTTLDEAKDIDRQADTPHLLPSDRAGDLLTDYTAVVNNQLPRERRRRKIAEAEVQQLSRPTQDQLEERLEYAIDLMHASNASKSEAARRAARERPSSMPDDSESAVEQVDKDIRDSLDDDE